MAKIISSAPILLVKDVEETAKHYKEKLGFDDYGLFGEPPAFCISSRDSMRIMFSKADEKLIVPNWKIVDKMWNVYFWVDDVTALYEELQQRGATIDYTLYMTPYNNLEFGINDNNGYDIAFGQDMDPQTAG